MALIVLLLVEIAAVITAVVGVWMFSHGAALIVLGILTAVICERYSANERRYQATKAGKK